MSLRASSGSVSKVQRSSDLFCETRGSHQPRLRLHYGSWRIPVLEKGRLIFIRILNRRSVEIEGSRNNNLAPGLKGQNLISAVTSHWYWDIVPAPTFEEPFGLQLHPTVPEQLLGCLCAKQGSSKRIFSSTTLDLCHVCLRLRGQMGAGVLVREDHKRRDTKWRTSFLTIERASLAS